MPGVMLLLCASACSQPDQYLRFGPMVDMTGFIERITGGDTVWMRDALQKRFGEPVQQVRQPAGVLYRYYGFELTTRGDTLVRVALTDSRHTAPEGIRVGYAVSQVRRLFGTPLVQEEGQWTYRAQDALLLLAVEDGIVTRITWLLNADPVGGEGFEPPTSCL